jgi:hypothetical protein
MDPFDPSRYMGPPSIVGKTTSGSAEGQNASSDFNGSEKELVSVSSLLTIVFQSHPLTLAQKPNPSHGQLQHLPQPMGSRQLWRLNDSL